MELKETILRFLYKRNNGRLTDLTELLSQYDNDRQTIRSTLFNLEKDKIIEIENDYNRLIFQHAGKYSPLSSVDLLARLTPFGELYYKEHYEEKEKLSQKIKIDIGQIQSISDSTINGSVTQSLDFSSKSKNVITPPTEAANHIITNVVIGIIITIIGGLLLYYFVVIS